MYQRYIAAAITGALTDTPVILVNGARQTGKSTFCHQLPLSGAFSGQMVTPDDPTVLNAAQTYPTSFLSMKRIQLKQKTRNKSRSFAH